MEFSSAKDQVSATLVTRPGLGETVGAGGVYTVECVGPDGQVKWADSFHNLVMNAGLANMNGVYLGTGAQSPTWYLGLVTGPASGTRGASGSRRKNRKASRKNRKTSRKNRKSSRKSRRSNL